MLEFNVKHNMLFFRISSDIVPFASHPVCKFNWQKHFRDSFKKIGLFIQKHNIRISLHPDQFTLINSIDDDIFKRTVKELTYHAQMLDLMKLNTSAKLQIHVGGVYGDKTKSMKRFISRYKTLDTSIRRRLVIENDDKSYTLTDCLYINKNTGIPILYDVFHHLVNSSGESVHNSIKLVSETWKKRDGILMVDYSLQKPDARAGSHAESIKISDFKKFISQSKPYDFDIMLEIKDKEKSALKAIKAVNKDKRFLKE
jgi:UV DNA damage endonuclease